MKNHIMISVLMILILGGSVQAETAMGSESVTRDLVAKWVNKRDDISIRIVQAWLRQEPTSHRQELMASWANTCLNIAITTREDEPMLSELSKYDCKAAGLLDYQLSRKGVRIRSGDSFAGIRFSIYNRSSY